MPEEKQGTDYIFLLKILAVAVALIALQSFIVSYADASNVTVEYPTATPTANITPSPTIPPYLQQGDVACLGDTVDVSGVVPPYPQLAYWDGYDMYDASPKYNISMPPYKIAYYRFYLDPAVFKDKLGKWYKYSGEFERQGNNLAFIVRDCNTSRMYSTVYPNGTIIKTPIFENVTYTPMVTPVPPLLPEKRESDYLVTTEESLNVSIHTKSAVWLFNSRNNGISYAVNLTDDNVTLDNTQIRSFADGDYKMIIQNIGNESSWFDVVYDNAKKQIKYFDRASFDVKTIDVQNMVPEIAIKRLSQIFPQTRDQFKVVNVAIQKPVITINSMEQVSVGSAKEYYKDSNLRGNVSLMDVRGYTNVQPGTKVSVTFDESQQNPRYLHKFTYSTVAEGDMPGEWRQYKVYVPLYWDDIAADVHTLTARTALGGQAFADFTVSEMPADSYIPPQKVKWADERNPWVPTPTPEVIEKVVEKEVRTVQTVVVTITPDEQQIYTQQKKAQNDLAVEYGKYCAIAVLAVLLLYLGAKYAMSVKRRLNNDGERKW